MISLRHLACIAGGLLLAAHADAQQRPATSGSTDIVTPAPERTGPSHPYVDAVSAPAPLQLRGNAVPTGLSGFYDYQSNGGSPGYIVVSPANPNHIHTVTMTATANTDADAISASRRVGYAYSSDGGNTWTASKAIDGIKLGYPFIQLLPDNNPIIGTHGDVGGLRTLFYVASTEGETNFFQVGGTEDATSSGRTDGTIWPSFVIDPKNPSHAVVVSSLSYPTGQQAAPLQVTTFDIDAATAGPWKQIAEDSLISTTSGGRYMMARSAGGKIGVAYFHYQDVNNNEDIVNRGVWLTESTNGGTTWSTPELVIGNLYTDDYMNNDDQDTVFLGPNVDLVYNGEEPHVVTNGIAGGFTETGSTVLFRSTAIYYWSRTAGVKRIAVTDPTIGLGVQTGAPAKTQSNVAYVSYPTLSVGKTGNSVVVAFQAAAQSSTDEPAVVSEEGFNYFRLWGVGSRDGGVTWGRPFIIQDFGGEEGDSASIEYPSAADISQVDGAGNLQLDLTFQARRSPGMYAFVADLGGGTSADAGPINETFQYFQRVTVTPQMMGAPASVGMSGESRRAGTIRIYPSQTSASATVDYTLAASGAISIRLYNALGAEVMSVADASTAAAGHYTKSIDLSAVPAGVYRCVVMQNGVAVSAPVVVTR